LKLKQRLWKTIIHAKLPLTNNTKISLALVRVWGLGFGVYNGSILAKNYTPYKSIQDFFK
jgi:hypothetical protein